MQIKHCKHGLKANTSLFDDVLTIFDTCSTYLTYKVYIFVLQKQSKLLCFFITFSDVPYKCITFCHTSVDPIRNDGL